jgi:iron complex outermembrane recepter protein
MIKTHRHRAPIILLLCLMTAAMTLLADETSRTFDIPAQPLTDALLQYSEISGTKVFFSTALTKPLKSTAVKGRYSAAQALHKLLQDSGLRIRPTYPGAVTVEQDQRPVSQNRGATGMKPMPLVKAAAEIDNSEGQVMPKVTVEADSEYDPEYYADPYNKNYVIPNATVGTKTDTPIMETPLNVQVISKQVLKDQQMIRLTDSLKNVSGVTTINHAGSPFNFGGSAQSIFLRGFESETYMRNGFRLQQGSTSRELANVEAVEVLKGPAAILYGLVEPGGMVNIVTKQPLTTPYYGFTQQFGSYDLYRTTFDASGPLTQNKDVLYRANLSYENSGSFRDFVGREDVFFAPVLRWNISPKTEITFEMEYNRLHQGLDVQFVPVIPGFKMPISRNYGGYNPSTTETIFGGFNWSHQFDDDWVLKHSFSVNQQSFNTPFTTNLEFAGTKAEIQNYFGIVDGDSVLNALPSGSYVPRSMYTADFQNNTTSTNLDLVGHFDTVGLKHTLLLGGDYYGLDGTFHQGSQSNSPGDLSYIPINNPGGSVTPFGPSFQFYKTPKTEHTDQYGLYIQDQIKLPYDVQVMGGIRYQYIHQTSFTQFSPVFGGRTFLSGSTQDAVTPRVGILWHPKSWLSLYANYAESFGANQGKTFVSDGVGKIIAPTSAAQYEGGVKFEFFDGKLRANLTYYDLTKTNVAVGDPNPFHNCGTGGFSAGASDCQIALGEVRSRGPEIDIQGEILLGWNVIATWSNTDIRIGGNEPVFSGGDIAFKPGSRVPNVPRNTGSLWNTYEVQGGDFKGLTVGGGVTLRDSQIAPDFVEPLSKVPGYATLDLMASYSRQVGDAKVSIKFNVNNLLDKQYSSSRYDNKQGHGYWANFGTPRTFMGQVSVQY